MTLWSNITSITFHFQTCVEVSCCCVASLCCQFSAWPFLCLYYSQWSCFLQFYCLSQCSFLFCYPFKMLYVMFLVFFCSSLRHSGESQPPPHSLGSLGMSLAGQFSNPAITLIWFHLKAYYYMHLKLWDPNHTFYWNIPFLMRGKL